MLISVADADPAARTTIARALMAADFAVLEAGDGVHALRQVFSARPDGIVVDFNIPLLGGLELVRVLRAASDLPIIVVAEHPANGTAVRALDAGADDFLRKPVYAPELVARLRATIRRRGRNAAAHAVEGEVVLTGALSIDCSSQRVTLRGEAVTLTRTERQLLEAMARRLDEVCPHRYLLATVWGDEYADDTHYLRTYMATLRLKLEDDPARPRLLLTEWGTGYRLAALPVEAPRALDDACALDGCDTQLVAAARGDGVQRVQP